MGFTAAQILKLQQDGKIRGHNLPGQAKSGVHTRERANALPTKESPKSALKREIKAYCFENGFTYIGEKQFHVERRWRADHAIITKTGLKIAVEYEGIYGKGKSRHTTRTGFEGDVEKYNTLTADGWHLFRFTTKSAGNAVQIIEKFIKSKNSNH